MSPPAADVVKMEEEEKPIVPLTEDEAQEIRDRLDELRGWYKQYERLLKDSPNGTQLLKIHRGGLDKSKLNESGKEKGDKANANDPKKEEKVEMPQGRTMNELQAKLREYISGCEDGSAHIDDIVEHANTFLGDLRRPDGTLYSRSNSKKAVIANLRTSTIAKVMFRRHPEKEDHWVVTEEGAALPPPPPREPTPASEDEEEGGAGGEAGEGDNQQTEGDGEGDADANADVGDAVVDENAGNADEAEDAGSEDDAEGTATGADAEDDTPVADANQDKDGDVEMADTADNNAGYEDMASAIKRRRRGASARSTRSGGNAEPAAVKPAEPAAAAAAPEPEAAAPAPAAAQPAPTAGSGKRQQPPQPPLANSSISGSNAPRRGGRRSRNVATAPAPPQPPVPAGIATEEPAAAADDGGSTRRSTRKRNARGAPTPPAPKRAKTGGDAAPEPAPPVAMDPAALAEPAPAEAEASTTGAPPPAAAPAAASEGADASGGAKTGYPGPGYKCKCGATAPGRPGNNKWKQTPWGDWMCNACMQHVKEKNYCPICYVIYRDDQIDDNNQWIGCDECNRWLHAKCDGITDLSIYDEDAHPDTALKYFCPDCRPAGKGPKWQKKR